jgi:hypothetical protein
MLFHDEDTRVSFGAALDQISVMKRCDCMPAGRYDNRTRLIVS